MKRARLFTYIVLATLLVPTMAAGAQVSSPLVVGTAVSCSSVEFVVNAPGVSPAYELSWNLGDDVVLVEEGISEFPHVLVHDYLAAGEYVWSISISDGTASEQTGGTVSIEGPSVNLTSDPFPPLLNAESDGLVTFLAEAEGGETPYTYTWDLNGDGVLDDPGDPESPGAASYIYSEPGKVVVQVRVTDACGFSASATLPVLLNDPEEEDENGEGSCHPAAQKIADGINVLFPDQAETLYTCEEIYDMFVGGLTGSQLGFGILDHAIKLAESIEDLTWEEIRDWHLDGTGWGMLAQLDRYAEAVDGIGIGDLLELVKSGDYEFADIRTALRYTVRFDTNFEDVLARLDAGASPGEIGQLYRTAQELDIDPTDLDTYLDAGVRLSDIKHAAKSADQLGIDWVDVLDAVEAGHGWGEIKQAYQLADDNVSAEEILAMGIKEYRKQSREQEQATRQEERDQRMAAQIASKFGVSEDAVWALYKGTCSSDWGCVRKYYQKNK